MLGKVKNAMLSIMTTGYQDLNLQLATSLKNPGYFLIEYDTTGYINKYRSKI